MTWWTLVLIAFAVLILLTVLGSLIGRVIATPDDDEPEYWS